MVVVLGASQLDLNVPAGVATTREIRVVRPPPVASSWQNHPAGSVAVTGTNAPRRAMLPWDVIVTEAGEAVARLVAAAAMASEPMTPIGSAR